MRTLLQPGDHLITTTSTGNNSWCDGPSVLVCDKQVRWIWPDWGCVCIYISFSTSQVNHEMFLKLLHVAFVYLYTQSPPLCWITASLYKKKQKTRRRTWRTDHSSFLKSAQARILIAEVPERHESLMQTSGLSSLTVLYHGAEGRGTVGGLAVDRGVRPHQERAAIYGVLPLLGGRCRFWQGTGGGNISLQVTSIHLVWCHGDASVSWRKEERERWQLYFINV